MHHYVYRTTTDKLAEHVDEVQASGDLVLSSTPIDGRNWVLLCRNGEPTVADLSPAELRAVVRDGVLDALRARAARPAASPAKAGL